MGERGERTLRRYIDECDGNECKCDGDEDDV